MARVIYTGPGTITSPIVAGETEVDFTEDRGQFISEDISDDVAAYLASIPGYVLAGTAKEADPPKPAAGTQKPPKGGATQPADTGAANQGA